MPGGSRSEPVGRENIVQKLRSIESARERAGEQQRTGGEAKEDNEDVPRVRAQAELVDATREIDATQARAVRPSARPLAHASPTKY